VSRRQLHLWACDCIYLARRLKDRELLRTAHALLNEAIRMGRAGL